MNGVKLLKRINLGNYSHWEVEVAIEDGHEEIALRRAVALMNRALETLGQDSIGVRKSE